jgi:DHA2 family multidrug resistance protein
LTAQTGDPNLYGPLVFRSAALGFLFVPLTVASLGGLRPQDRGAGSGIVNFMRQFGGSVGIATMSTVLDRQVDYHRAWLVTFVNSGNPIVEGWLRGAQGLLLTHGYSPTAGQASAMSLLARTVESQAYILAFNDCFRLVAGVFLLALPIALLFKRPSGKVDMSEAH